MGLFKNDPSFRILYQSLSLLHFLLYVPYVIFYTSVTTLISITIEPQWLEGLNIPLFWLLFCSCADNGSSRCNHVLWQWLSCFSPASMHSAGAQTTIVGRNGTVWVVCFNAAISKQCPLFQLVLSKILLLCYCQFCQFQKYVTVITDANSLFYNNI